MAQQQGPLNWNVPIVDKSGLPTPEFMRKWLAQISTNGSIPTASGTGIFVQTSSSSWVVRLIAGGTGITVANGSGVAGNPTISLANTAVTPTTYGDSTHVGQFTVDAQGRLTAAVNVAIAYPAAMEIKDEGSSLTTTPVSMDFVGAGVTATVSTNAVTVTIPGSTPVVYEWNPDDCNWTGIIIGPDGRAIYNGYVGGTYGAVRGVQARSSGKYYFEFKVGAVHSPAPGVGVGSSLATLQNYAGSDANAWAIWCDGAARHSGLTTAENTYAAGDIMGIAVDFTASTGSIKFFKNNAAQTNAYTGLTLGTMYPIATLQTNTTINWGRLALTASEQTYSPPAGYSSWS